MEIKEHQMMNKKVFMTLDIVAALLTVVLMLGLPASLTRAQNRVPSKWEMRQRERPFLKINGRPVTPLEVGVKPDRA